jgi:hypothetical protein
MFVTTETRVLGFFHARHHPYRGELRLFYINLREILPDRKSQKGWLDKPNTKLGGHTPNDAIRHGQIHLASHILTQDLGHYRLY